MTSSLFDPIQKDQDLNLFTIWWKIVEIGSILCLGVLGEYSEIFFTCFPGTLKYFSWELCSFLRDCVRLQQIFTHFKHYCVYSVQIKGIKCNFKKEKMFQQLKVDVKYTFVDFHLLKHYVRFQRVTIPSGKKDDYTKKICVYFTCTVYS